MNLERQPSYSRRNLSPDMTTALRTLANDPNIVIKSADKGGGIVVQDTDAYVIEARRQLSDRQYYTELPSDPTVTISDLIHHILLQALEQGIITDREYRFLHQNYPTIPVIYFVPKIHKHLSKPPGRPIVSGIGSVLEPLSDFVDFYLKPLVSGAKSYVKDTTSMLIWLQEPHQIPSGSLMATLDIQALYTNIPQCSAIAVGLEANLILFQLPVVSFETESESSNVMFVDSSFSSADGSALPQKFSRDQIAYEVNVKHRHIEEICISCGSLEVDAQHPIFHGALCPPCKENFLHVFFLYDPDGCQSYCTICSGGRTLFICDVPSCSRCYCAKCLDILVKPGTACRVKAMDIWFCFLCLPVNRHGLLQRRVKWRTCVKRLYDEYGFVNIFKPLSASKRHAIRVLSLFSDISVEMTKLGFIGNTSGKGTITYIHDVSLMTRKDVRELGDIDFVFGATPGTGGYFAYPSAWYFYQYYRILSYAQQQANNLQCFFWMFVDNLVLEEEVKDAATFRFFETNPVTICDVHHETIFSAAHVWGNIPSLKSKYASPDWDLDLSMFFKKRDFQIQPVPKILKRFLAPLKEYFKCFPGLL
uniref:DNA (Cytosine-5)-methyltransferase 3-like n=1 Tax=Geotrypetes seraphini TaxID=260995 RepID=A0A6P8QSE5_GEOSA|nr:DNA (cytosine-5)-methyltransferase 3-like [Geotrypetes seraphini]